MFIVSLYFKYSCPSVSMSSYLSGLYFVNRQLQPNICAGCIIIVLPYHCQCQQVTNSQWPLWCYCDVFLQRKIITSSECSMCGQLGYLSCPKIISCQVCLAKELPSNILRLLDIAPSHELFLGLMLFRIDYSWKTSLLEAYGISAHLLFKGI